MSGAGLVVQEIFRLLQAEESSSKHVTTLLNGQKWTFVWRVKTEEARRAVTEARRAVTEVLNVGRSSAVDRSLDLGLQRRKIPLSIAAAC